MFGVILGVLAQRYLSRLLDVIEPRILETAGTAMKAIAPPLSNLRAQAFHFAPYAILVAACWKLGGLSIGIGAVLGILLSSAILRLTRRVPWLAALSD